MNIKKIIIIALVSMSFTGTIAYADSGFIGQKGMVWIGRVNPAGANDGQIDKYYDEDNGVVCYLYTENSIAVTSPASISCLQPK